MSLFYLACTDSASTCEAISPWELNLGGVAGLCNTSTNVCECPPGYTGDDLFGAWNDCHISQQVMLGIDAFALTVVTAAWLVSVASSVYVLTKWKIIRFFVHLQVDAAATLVPVTTPVSEVSSGAPPSKRISKNSFESAEQAQSPRRLSVIMIDPSILILPKINAPSPAHNFRVVEVKRRRIILITYFFMSGYAATSILFEATRLAFRNRLEQTAWYQFVLIAAIVNCFIVSLWLIILSWWKNLPSLKTYAALFPSIRSNPLIRYPFFVELASALNIVGVVSCIFVFFFVMPLAVPRLLLVWVEAGFTVLAAGFLVISLMFIHVSILLIHLFNMLDKNPGKEQGGRGASYAISTLKLVVAIAAIMGSYGLVMALLTGWDPFVQRNFYLFVPILIASGGGVGIVASWIITMRLT